MISLSIHPQGTVLPVHAQPGARRNAILGERAGSVRVAVTAAPDKGKANAAILEFLADILGCRNSQVSLLSGETARQKRFLITGLDPEELQRRIAQLMPREES